MFVISDPSARGVADAREGRSAVITGRGVGVFFAGVASETVPTASCLRTRVRALLDGAVATVFLIAGIAATGLERAGASDCLVTTDLVDGFAAVFLEAICLDAADFGEVFFDFSGAAPLTLLVAAFLVAFFAPFFEALGLAAPCFVAVFVDFFAAFFLACFFAMALLLSSRNPQFQKSNRDCSERV